MWQALPESRHLIIAILGKLKISLNDVGMSSDYLAPAIAQIMANYKFGYSGCSIFSSTSRDEESRISLGSHSHGDF